VVERASIVPLRNLEMIVDDFYRATSVFGQKRIFKSAVGVIVKLWMAATLWK